MKTKIALAVLAFAGITSIPATVDACTRAVYKGANGLVITGRTMDWQEDLHSNIYLFPRNMKRSGGNDGNTVEWSSKYGSVITAGYDIGTCDGMNEAGLVANLLYLPEAEYVRENDTRPVMGVSIWTQYVLDNFATVSEAVSALQADAFRIDAPVLPNGAKSTLHMSISDPSGNNAIIEYVEGEIRIYESPNYVVMTNSPTYDKQLSINNYWKEVGGLKMLPGTNRSSDRFVRASFYIDALPKNASTVEAWSGVLGVIRNVSVPLGISTPDQPHISSTRWRTVADQTNKVYYFESVLKPNVISIDLNKIDFGNSPVMKLTLDTDTVYTGEVNNKFKKSEPFSFLFSTIQ